MNVLLILMVVTRDVKTTLVHFSVLVIMDMFSLAMEERVLVSHMHVYALCVFECRKKNSFHWRGEGVWGYSPKTMQN